MWAGPPLCGPAHLRRISGRCRHWVGAIWSMKPGFCSSHCWTDASYSASDVASFSLNMTFSSEWSSSPVRREVLHPLRHLREVLGEAGTAEGVDLLRVTEGVLRVLQVADREGVVGPVRAATG